jgi:hypothetical protein
MVEEFCNLLNQLQAHRLQIHPNQNYLADFVVLFDFCHNTGRRQQLNCMPEETTQA